MPQFILLHVPVDRVQAIALGSGTIVGAHRQMNPRVQIRLLRDGANRGFVVGVNAHEHVVIRVADARQVTFEHLPDHTIFAPQGHEDGNPPLGFRVQLRLRRPGKRSPAGEDVNQADKKVV